MPSASEEINAKLDWCVEALKKLLELQAGIEPDEDAWLDEIDAEVPDYVVPKHEPKPKPCSHNQQMVVNGAVCCAKCGLKLVQGGVVGDPQRNGNEAIRAEWGGNSWRDAAANLT